MSTGTGELAEKAADEIINDLAGRKGIGDEWDYIDDDIRAEIRAEWIGYIRRVIESIPQMVL